VKPLVYVAGPYSQPDPVENMNKAVHIANGLLATGEVTPYIPHLSGFWHAITPKPYDFWLAYDLEIMARCDAVFRFTGESAGADKEVIQAAEWDIPVFHDIDSLTAWARDRARV
jgi:hypothetical protein